MYPAHPIPWLLMPWRSRTRVTSGIALRDLCWNVLASVPGPRFSIKMSSSYQYRKSHCGDKTVVRSSYLHNGISCSGKTTSLYWIMAQKVNHSYFHDRYLHRNNRSLSILFYGTITLVANPWTTLLGEQDRQSQEISWPAEEMKVFIMTCEQNGTLLLR